MYKPIVPVFLFLLLVSQVWSQCDSLEVELWGECYPINETTILDFSDSNLNGSLSGEIPPELGTLINLTFLSQTKRMLLLK